MQWYHLYFYLSTIGKLVPVPCKCLFVHQEHLVEHVSWVKAHSVFITYYCLSIISINIKWVNIDYAVCLYVVCLFLPTSSSKLSINFGQRAKKLKKISFGFIFSSIFLLDLSINLDYNSVRYSLIILLIHFSALSMSSFTSVDSILLHSSLVLRNSVTCLTYY